jgi:uncharacterized protein YbjT (DUF2867 family)
MVNVLITGATGKQGGATARALLQAGHSVNALVRDAASAAAQALKSQGARLFEGDWDNREALEAAITGTTALFFHSMPSFTDADAETRWTTNIVEAAQQAGTVEHVVYSTVHGMEHYEKVPNWDRNSFLIGYYESKSRGEQLVRTAGFKYYTILRPTEFMSNLVIPMAGWQYPDLVVSGTWRNAFPLDFKVDFVDIEDVGRVAAKAILDPEGFPGREVDVTAESIPVSEIMDLLSKETGKTLRAQTNSLEEAERIAVENPLEQGRLIRMALAEAKLRGERPDFGITFKGLKDFLKDNHDDVVETYKNVP